MSCLLFDQTILRFLYFRAAQQHNFVVPWYHQTNLVFAWFLIASNEIILNILRYLLQPFQRFNCGHHISNAVNNILLFFTQKTFNWPQILLLFPFFTRTAPRKLPTLFQVREKYLLRKKVTQHPQLFFMKSTHYFFIRSQCDNCLLIYRFEL